MVDTIIKEVYGLTVLYRHIYAVKGTILSHFRGPKVTLKTIAKVNKLENLIIKLNFYKIISYLVDQCICPARSRSHQTLEKKRPELGSDRDR